MPVLVHLISTLMSKPLINRIVFTLIILALLLFVADMVIETI
jgi:hypothetical protein